MKEKKHKETVDRLIHDIRYELADGEHTYHVCDCGRESCRNRCVYCLADNFYDERNLAGGI